MISIYVKVFNLLDMFSIYYKDCSNGGLKGTLYLIEKSLCNIMYTLILV